MLDHMSVLRAFLDAQGTGPLADRLALISFLEPVWPDLAGASAGTMEPWKLGRMEKPAWMPPLLTFVIERHAESEPGSTRAGLQAWTIDLDSVTATPAPIGYRQKLLRADSPRVGPVVAEVVRLVVNSLDNAWLNWSVDRQTVQIAVGEIIPDEGPKLTVAGRRRRFRVRLKKEMAAVGWAKTGPTTFAHVQADVRS